MMTLKLQPASQFQSTKEIPLPRQKPKSKSKSKPKSRKADKLRIPRDTVGSDPRLAELLLHVDAPRFVKAHAALLHDALDVPFRGPVESRPAVAFGDVGRQVEVRRVQSCFGVRGERCRETCVGALREVCAWRCREEVVGPRWEVWKPAVAG